MRTLKDRIRHTLLFEGIALGIVAVGGSWITGHSLEAIGLLSIMFSLLAMSWNFVFNWLFDQWDMKYRNMAPRGPGIRVVHAILFEAVLLTVGIFLTAWWLSIGYVETFLLDLGFSAFFLVYAYIYNWGYDVIFPVPRPTEG
ncbi:MAG: PACE efflux transporter [Rhodobacteraceae bacterium]|nr:PACE efflux transporter [Paracoccaceae bacterium]